MGAAVAIELRPAGLHQRTWEVMERTPNFLVPGSF